MNSDRLLPKSVLVVGMLDSPHLARWLHTLKDLPVQFVVFPSSPHRKVHPEIRDLLTGRQTARVTLTRIESYLTILIWAVDLLFGGRLRGYLLSRRINAIEPQLVHALELQHAGYTLLWAMNWVPACNTKIAVTNYGSDIYWFERFSSHEKRLRKLLKMTDFYGAECQRDVDAAISLGLTGRVLTVLPNAGGISEINSLQPFDSNQILQRKIVLVKGYTNFVGRAQDIIKELARNSNKLKGWSIIVYSATIHARLLCLLLRTIRPDLNLHAIRKRQLSHQEMMTLFSNAAAYVGFSKSDGASTSFLEALAFGAYPLQTDTACIAEWEQVGVVLSPLNIKNPTAAVYELLKVLEDKDLRVHAASINQKIARMRLDSKMIGIQMCDDYRKILEL